MIRFVKAHACGNDFLVVEARQISAERQREMAIHLCARNTGIGADGVEYLEWTGERAGRIRLFNADGSIAEISGNGTRCVAAWMAHEKGLQCGDILTLETDAGPRECRIVDASSSHYQIASRMGIPEISMRSVDLNGKQVEGVVVSVGNPHFVIFVPDGSFTILGRSWQEIGQDICFHPDFPQQTNVEFVHILNVNEIEFRIFERGVGPTASSGTGACASAVATISQRGGAKHLLARSLGGEQRVEWDRTGEILLTGPAELIAQGEAF